MLDIMHLHLACQPVFQDPTDVSIRRFVIAARHRPYAQLHRFRERHQEIRRHLRVLDRVMQQSHALRSGIVRRLPHTPGDFDRMLGIRSAGAIEHAEVPAITQTQRVLDQRLPFDLCADVEVGPAGAGTCAMHGEWG